MKSRGMRSLKRRASRGISRLFLKAKIYRTRQLLHLEPKNVSDLLVFQYNAGSAKFYLDTIGHVPIRLFESPHALFAKEVSTSFPAGEGEGHSVYRKFLEASWSALPNANTRNLDEKIEQFRRFVSQRQRTNVTLSPITVTRMPRSDELFIVDGNHRAAVALALRSPLEAHFVPFDLVFSRYLTPSEYYGSGHRGRPYQTIYYNQEPAILGRRTDIFQRLDLLPRGILADAAVLDVGSNVGMNALAAGWRGATPVLGLEQSNHLVNTATRLSVLNGLYPNVTFRRFDVDVDTLAPSIQFDACFMLAVYQHLRDPSRLLRIVESNVHKWVVFEGHPGSPYELYKPFFESGLFDRVTKIGELSHSAADTLTRPRPLWLCTKVGSSAPQ